MRAARTWIFFFPMREVEALSLDKADSSAQCMGKEKEMVCTNLEFLCMETLIHISGYKGDLILSHILLLNLFPQLEVFFKNKFIYLFIYFWLCWVFVAACGLSLVVASGGYSLCGVRASHCSGFFCCGARALGMWASVVVARGLGSCGTRA